ncbi:MAG: hypothetical protein PHZ25_01755 [Candidatus Pacebacteria bacterium]|nr:hypothetical protein [Candidatus Paceibacterota bacterium]
MKLNKNRIISIVIFIVIIISVILFVIFNFSIFDKRKDFMEKERIACQDLDLNDGCSFYVKNEQILGQCSKFKNSPLVCKPIKN